MWLTDILGAEISCKTANLWLPGSMARWAVLIMYDINEKDCLVNNCLVKNKPAAQAAGANPSR